MAPKLVHLKGDNETINIYIRKGKIETIVDELEKKLEESKGFFFGAKVNQIVGESLSLSDMQILENILTKKYNMVIVDKKDIFNDKSDSFFEKEIFEPASDTEEMPDTSNLLESAKILESVSQDKTEDLQTLFLKTTVRSGQVIDYDGNVVIIGDVNPGGMIVAKGNIVVLGTLKGVAKAGSDGNIDSVVIALRLQPTQIGIANVITRMPDEDVVEVGNPEIAKLEGKLIKIEGLLKK